MKFFDDGRIVERSRAWLWIRSTSVPILTLPYTLVRAGLLFNLSFGLLTEKTVMNTLPWQDF